MATAFSFAIPSWHAQAACTDTSVNFIIEPASGLEHPGSVVKAFEVCAGCPVRRPCLRSSFDAPFSLTGIFGGSTLTERRKTLRGGERRSAQVWNQEVNEAVAILEATFSARLAGWRARVELQKVSRG